MTANKVDERRKDCCKNYYEKTFFIKIYLVKKISLSYSNRSKLDKPKNLFTVELEVYSFFCNRLMKTLLMRSVYYNQDF